MFVPGLNGSSLGGELPFDLFFFFWFFGVVEEGELLLEDEWEGFTVCCCEQFGPLLFPWHSFGLIGCLLLFLVWLNSTLSSAVIFTA